MGATCTVRERHVDDLPALADVLIRVHSQDGYPVEGVANPFAWLDHPHALHNWTALVDDVPVGQVTLTNASFDDEAGATWVAHTGGSVTDLAIIVRLFVDPDRRVMGAGRSLIEAALTYGTRIGRSVALDVMKKDQAAIRLYERLGGRRLGEVTHHYGDGLAEPAVVFDFPNKGIRQ